MSAKYALIRREEGTFPTGLMIGWMGVSSSGYYDWRDRPASARALRRRELSVIVRWHFEDSDGTYGYRRIAAAMNAAGQHVDPGTVKAIMAAQGLVAAQPRRSGPKTTIPARDLAQVPDLVQRDFTATEPGVKLVGDITYIRTWEGWVYLAVVLDCYSKKVLGWAMADHMRADLVIEAMAMAARNGHVRYGVSIFHSDRGSQYTSEAYRVFCHSRGITRSMGRTGVCWDNAYAESWNGTLKNERVNRMVYPTREKAIQDVAHWIELRYNHKRLHSALGYATPNQFHESFDAGQVSA